MAEKKIDLAIIGGTGLYNIPGMNIIETVLPQTPWGTPSDEITIASFTEGGKSLRVGFLPRHGKGHFIMPTEINQRANIASLKMLGASHIIAFSAVGSLKEEIAPRHFIIPDQVIDRTRHRTDTFYGEGIVVHATFGDPFCSDLSALCEKAVKACGITCHTGETLVCMEGPAFSTRAESKLYKSWGAGIINMSVIPEAKLARELEICYQMICMSTDYDSWREEEGAVTADEIMAVVKDNSQGAVKVVGELVKSFTKDKPCQFEGSLKYAIITAPEKRPGQTKEKLNQVLPGYF